MADVAQALNIEDLAAMARRRLPKGLYAFVDRGAEDETTLRENAASLKRVSFRQRVGVDVSNRDISTTLFGTKLAMPVAVAVTGLAGMLAYQGEHQLAHAAAKAGVPFTIGSSNFTAQAELLPICGELLWRQIYPPKDTQRLDHYIGVSKELGVRVLQVTLDSPVVGNREYMRRSGWGPGIMHAGTYLDMLGAPHWLFGTLARYMINGGLPELDDWPQTSRRFWGGPHTYGATGQDFTWEHFRELRRKWDGVLVAKGLSTAEDARIALDCGADGVIVSNHGGRSLDGCIPSFRALPEVVDAVAGKIPVIVDGGFRRGADVVKALAAGASLVMVGRATLHGLAAGGEEGAARSLAIFREEIDRSLALIGCRSPVELTRNHIVLPD